MNPIPADATESRDADADLPPVFTALRGTEARAARRRRLALAGAVVVIAAGLVAIGYPIVQAPVQVGLSQADLRRATGNMPIDEPPAAEPRANAALPAAADPPSARGGVRAAAAPPAPPRLTAEPVRGRERARPDPSAPANARATAPAMATAAAPPTALAARPAAVPTTVPPPARAAAESDAGRAAAILGLRPEAAVPAPGAAAPANARTAAGACDAATALLGLCAASVSARSGAPAGATATSPTASPDGDAASTTPSTLPSNPQRQP